MSREIVDKIVTMVGDMKTVRHVEIITKYCVLAIPKIGPEWTFILFRKIPLSMVLRIDTAMIKVRG